MSRDTDLLPCPFCGAEPPDLHLSHITGRIFCEGCGAEGPWSPAFDGDWNTRAHPAQEPPSPGVTAGVTGVDADRLLKDALFASIEPTHRSPLYSGVAVTAMTQACAAVFYVPRDWTRDQIRSWLGNPQGFATPAPVVPADQRAAIEALADRMWRVHPKDIFDAGYEHIERGGKYDNPRAAWYADQIEALFKQFQDQASPVVTTDSLAMARFDLEQATRQIENDRAALMHLCRKHGMVGDLPMQWLDERLSAPPVSARVIAEKAYLAGFNAAGEGYNGEWPFHDKGISPDTDEGWLIGRDMALAAYEARREK